MKSQVHLLKELLLTIVILLLLFTSSLAQQWTGSSTSTGTIFRNGHVVIGNTALEGSYASTARVLQLRGSESWLSMRDPNGSFFNLGFSSAFGTGFYSSSVPIKFWTSPTINGAFTERMTIATNGSVGINNPNPNFPLDVNGSINTNAYEVIPGNGNGLRFWQSDWYKIHMGIGGEYQYGPVTDYSIKMNMNSTPGRGWTWGIHGQVPVAAIANNGNMQIAGSFVANGNIGIGTTSPTAKLEIIQSAGGSGQNKGLKIGAGNDYNYFGNSQLSFAWGGGGYAHSIRTRHNSSGISGNAIDFYVWKPGDGVNEDGSLNVMTLNGDRVGIGTSQPNSSLSIKGRFGIRADAAPTSPTETMRIEGAISSEENVVNVTNLSDQDFIVKISGAGAAIKRTIIGPSTVNRLSLAVGVNSNEHLTIINGGNVGIGTTSPSGKLDINHAGGQLRLSGGTVAGGVWTNNTDILYLADWDTGSKGLNINMTSGNVGIGTAPAFKLDVAGPINATSLNVNGQPFVGSKWTASGSNIYYTAGKVGIGTPLTTNPNDYTLAVNGKIGTKDVQIEAGSTTWPDYVFEPTYKLPSLSEVEKYILTHKHLDGVPSAENVEKNGYSMSELDAALLRKLEEMTLYMIEQQKQIAKQQKQIDELKKTQGMGKKQRRSKTKQ